MHALNPPTLRVVLDEAVLHRAIGGPGQALAVRDSKCPTGGTLIVGARSRASFIEGVKTGRFDA